MRKKYIAIIFTILIFLILYITYNFVMKEILYNTAYEEIVHKYAEEYNVDEMLIFAIVKNESNFNNEIVSHRDAIGLMQILESTAEEVAYEMQLENIDLKDAETNVKIGVKYFSNLENKYGNYMLALAAYNAGQGNVDKWIEQGIISESGHNIEKIPFKETNMYVRKIVRDYRIYKALYN